MELHARTATLLLDTARMVRRRFDQAIRPVGLTEARWRAVAYVNTWPGLTQTELAELLDIEKAPAGTLIDRLQAEGLLRREADPGDRRVNRLHLQPAAGPVIAAMHSAFELILAGVGQCFSPLRQARLQALLEQLRQGMHSEADLDARQPPAGDCLSLVVSTARLLRRRMNRPLREMGFTPAQWWLLCAVQLRGGLTQTALADLLGIGRVPLGQLLDALEAEGWICRDADPEDRRAKRIRIANGREARLQQLFGRFDVLHAELLGGLQRPELTELDALLEALRDSLADSGRTTDPSSDPSPHRETP